VNEATTVTIHREMRMVMPVGNGSLIVTEHKPALVRALFGDICDAVSHAYNPTTAPQHCPADFATDYVGTFFDGSRTLASFVYAASGCQRVSVSAAGTTQSTMLLGQAAAAAPRLEADLTAIFGSSAPGVYQPVVRGTPVPNRPA
jgi:hypothetical protein